MNAIRNIYIAPSQARKRAYFQSWSAAQRFADRLRLGTYTISTLRHPASTLAFGYRVDWDWS